jgi:hypothetical protein
MVCSLRFVPSLVEEPVGASLVLVAMEVTTAVAAVTAPPLQSLAASLSYVAAARDKMDKVVRVVTRATEEGRYS